jgi:CRP-like cAMP-binding protein
MASSNKNSVDIKVLKTFPLLGELSLDKLEELAAKSSVCTIPPNRIVFRQGEKDKRIIFLLSGQLELAKTGNPKTELIRSKTSAAINPIAEAFPRLLSCKTKTECTFLNIDRDLLEILLLNDNSGLIEVEELGDNDENAWMIRFLESRAFLQLPTDNIQNLLINLEEIPAKKGEVIVQQGAKNEYYYIIQKGSCSVSRRPVPNSPDMQLAILKVGDGFGEEALITGGKRNASITMLEDGTLMRLNKHDFMSLLAEPLIKKINKDEAQDKIAKGSLLIDVRVHDEFVKHRVEGSVNIPLTMLRVKLDGLNLERDYILLCDDGARSAAAAFLLAQHGLNCFVLDGGLNKNNLVVPDASLASKVPTTQTKESIAADRSRQAADEKAAKIQKEAATAKSQAEQLAKRQAEAEAAKRKADAEITRLQKIEADKRDVALLAAKQRLNDDSRRAKKAEEDAAKLKLEAKTAKRKAEQELNNLRKETEVNETRQQELDTALSQAKTLAGDAAKASELARKKASTDAAKIRAQAKAEAEQLRKEMESTLSDLEQKAKLSHAVKAERHKAELTKTRTAALNEAEKIKRQARREAESFRAELDDTRKKEQQKATQEANKIAEQIRQQALEEAERLRSDLEATKLAMQEEATLLAEQEAKKIRQTALQEAEQLRGEIEQARRTAREEAKILAQKEAEQIRQQALNEAKKVQQSIQAENTRAQEKARYQAQQEAETIKQQALEEAESLRQEMEAAKNEAQEIAEAISAQEEQQRQLLEEARLHAEQITRSKSLKADQDVEQIRLEAAQESARLRDEIRETRRLLADQVSQARAGIESKQAEKLEQKKQQIKQKAVSAKQEQQEQQELRKRKAEKVLEMQRKAETIKARLEKAEKIRQQDEAEQQSEGMSLNKAKLRKIGNRIVLEGDQDIFIFKEPTLKPEDVEKEETVDEIIKEDNDLPSFIIDTPEDADYIPVSKAQISDTYNRYVEEQNESKSKQQYKMLAIAATVIVSTVLGVSLFIFQPEDQTSRIVNRTDTSATQNASITNIDTKKPKVSQRNKDKQKRKLQEHAEKRFDQLMKKWKQQSYQQPSKSSKNVVPQEPSVAVFPDKALEAAAEVEDPEVITTIDDVSNEVSLLDDEPNDNILSEPTTLTEPTVQQDDLSDSPDTASSLLDNLDSLN